MVQSVSSKVDSPSNSHRIPALMGVEDTLSTAYTNIRCEAGGTHSYHLRIKGHHYVYGVGGGGGVQFVTHLH
jgi:hypothetical protein